MANYGDLQGISLQSQELPTIPPASPNEPLIDILSSPNSNQITSPVSANSPDTTNPFAENFPAYNSVANNSPAQSAPSQNIPAQDISPQSPPAPYRPLIDEMIPANIKGALMEFCGKNKLSLPTFRREAPQSGSYTTVLTWIPPNSETAFEERATYPNKRDAENTVSARMLSRIKDWNANKNTQADVGDAKGSLQRIISLNSSRFFAPKYSTVLEGIHLFSTTLVVADTLGGDHVTHGRGVGKKTAEKEAAGKMIPILTEAISVKKSEPNDEYRNDIERLEAVSAVSFSGYHIEYQPCAQESKEMKYLLQSCSLILRKENFPSIVVATCSGLQLEEAKLACAKLAVQHLLSIKKMVDGQPK